MLIVQSLQRFTIALVIHSVDSTKNENNYHIIPSFGAIFGQRCRTRIFVVGAAGGR